VENNQRNKGEHKYELTAEEIEADKNSFLV